MRCPLYDDCGTTKDKCKESDMMIPFTCFTNSFAEKQETSSVPLDKIVMPVCPYCNDEMYLHKHDDYWGDPQIEWLCGCDDADLMKQLNVVDGG